VTVWIYPPHLINVATLPCESQNTKNVILQWDITKDNCIRCNIASSKWTRVIMCLKFTYVGCYTAKRAWNKDSWHRRPAKTLNANLLPAALRAAQACRYLIYSEADFEIFRPAGSTRFTDGGEIWHGGGDLWSPPPCQISPQGRGCRTPKIEIFTQIWPKCGIKTPRRGLSLARF